jgi:hypothetical protein
MEEIMRRWPRSALVFAGWVGLVSVITGKALQPAPPGPPYWRVVGVLGGIVTTLLLVWIYDYPQILRGALMLGLAWLLMLPFTPPIADVLLDVQTSRIEVGMTEAEVRTIMVGYRSNPYTSTDAPGVAGVTFCYDAACDTNANVEFRAGRVVRSSFRWD